MGAPCFVDSDVLIIVCYENNFGTRKHVVHFRSLGVYTIFLRGGGISFMNHVFSTQTDHLIATLF